MTALLVHAGGGWDELAIALVAFAVLWVAVKLAGRKSAADSEEVASAAEEHQTDPSAVGPPDGLPVSITGSLPTHQQPAEDASRSPGC